MATSGKAEQREPLSDTVDEPSMDDIMASIRQIIADDENASQEGVSEREQYTHPTNPSNVNEPVAAQGMVDGDGVLSSMEAEMMAVVEQEVATQMEAPVSMPVVEVEEPSVNEPDTLQEGVPIVEPVRPSSVLDATIASGAGLVASAVSIHERAEQVRSEIGLSSVDANGLTLEQRLEKYRVRSRRQEDIEKQRELERETERKAQEDAMQRIVEAMPAPVAQSITPNDVAQSLMNASGSAISADLTEIMRPAVRQWLSENLSGLVERLVREEIERVSRGRQAS